MNQNGYTVKEMIEFIYDDVKEIKNDVKKQNDRVRKNEIKIGYIYGGLALLGIAITIVRFF